MDRHPVRSVSHLLSWIDSRLPVTLYSGEFRTENEWIFLLLHDMGYTSIFILMSLAGCSAPSSCFNKLQDIKLWTTSNIMWVNNQAAISKVGGPWWDLGSIIKTVLSKYFEVWWGLFSCRNFMYWYPQCLHFRSPHLTPDYFPITAQRLVLMCVTEF